MALRTSLRATRPLVGRAFATLRPALLGASSRAPLAPPRAPFALTELRRGEPRYAIERELAEIVATLAEGDGGGGGCGEVLRARRALVAGIGLVLLQQLTGQPRSVVQHRQRRRQNGGCDPVDG